LRSLEEILESPKRNPAHPGVRYPVGVSRPILMLKLQAANGLKSVLNAVEDMPRKRFVGGLQRRWVTGAQLAVDFDDGFFRRADGNPIQRGARAATPMSSAFREEQRRPCP